MWQWRRIALQGSDQSGCPGVRDRRVEGNAPPFPLQRVEVDTRGNGGALPSRDLRDWLLLWVGRELARRRRTYFFTAASNQLLPKSLPPRFCRPPWPLRGLLPPSR